MLEIECAGEQLILLPQRGVFWPREASLIIADVHLGKPASFRRAGIPVPEAVTQGDLDRLTHVIQATRARRLVILGDLVHARSGLQAEVIDAVTRWRSLHSLSIVLVPGNHDRHAGSPPCEWRMEIAPECWSYPPFTFSHKPLPFSDQYLMAGHVHPAIVLRDALGHRLRAPCFCFGKRQALLPAFGCFTGMSDVPVEPGTRYFATNPSRDMIVEVPWANGEWRIANGRGAVF